MNSEIVSKVLVLENDASQAQTIRDFCKEHNLVALTVDASHLLSVLHSHIDLGAILYSEGFAGSPEDSAILALSFNEARPELPIILRRESVATLDGLPEISHRIFSAVYVSSNMAALSQVIDEHLFNMFYPNVLLRGIVEITQDALTSQFMDYSVTVDAPYIVRDRLMLGEIFSIIPLESTWCRGYMMLQTEERPLLAMLGLDIANDKKTNFRAANSLIGEVTNLIWGSFKNRFIGDAAAESGSTTQVPIVVNQKRGYISFGTDNPELCFRYTLRKGETSAPIVLYQRFAFSLQWSPENFKEIEQKVDELIDSGELEMF